MLTTRELIFLWTVIGLMTAGNSLLQAAELVPITAVTGSNGGDSAANGMISLTNGSGITKTNASDPATWSFNGTAYQDEWMAWYLKTGGVPALGLNGKLAWASFDFGTTKSLGKLYLFNNNYGLGISGVARFNLYWANSPTVPLPAQPAKNTFANTGLTPQGDYDFSSGGWTLINLAGALTATSSAINSFDLPGVSARYLAVEILGNYGDAYNGGRVGFDEIAVTTAPPDSDGDGFSDIYELANTTPSSSTALNRLDDLDTDNLTNWQELLRGTNPRNSDTDGDTLQDGAEVAGVGARPPTNPVLADTDGDGLSDLVEKNSGVFVSVSDTGTNPVNADTDGDGLTDGVENNSGVFVSANNPGTSPFNPDSDGDGAADWYEVAASFTNPSSASSSPGVPYPLPDPDASTGATNKPVKVFIMSGQSNMVGFGTVNGPDSKALSYITRTMNRFPNLIDSSGNFIARQDVMYRGVVSAIGNGPLAPGFGAKAANFGPELGFGQIMGWYHDEPVLLIKSSIGNRALGWDILPQGTPSWVYDGNNYAGYGQFGNWPVGGSPPTSGGWYAGKEFDRFFKHETEWAHPDTAAVNVVDVLDNFATQYPQYAAQGFEVSGFVWWQGERDLGVMGHAARYEDNLVRLITELRGYYSNRYPGKVVPNAPFVLGTLGEATKEMTTPASGVAIRNAHLAVDSATGSNPQVNVKTVYTNPLSEGGEGNGHYNLRAGTYIMVGDAMGRAMYDLLKASAGPDVTPPVPTSFNPTNGASDVSTGTNLVATFSESIAIGTGNITIHPIDNSGDIVIPVTDAAQVSVSGFSLTINPAANLSPTKQYAVKIDATAIDDLVGNSYAGITNNTTWSFTTATPDTTNPTLSTTNPANAASGVPGTANLVATFNESIAIGTGSITLRNLTDGSGGDIVIPVTDTAQVSISGSVLTVNPAANLLLGKTYAVQIAATAIDDLAGNSYPGILNDSTWSFATAPPDLTAPSPDPMSFAVLPTAINTTSIIMTATTATDPGGVEYFFECTAGDGPDSGWQSSTVFTPTGLTHSTTYSYTVTARDSAFNETAPSAAASATTATPDTTAPVISTFIPAVNATDVVVSANLVATFNEPITIGTGNITIHPIDNSGDRVIAVTDVTQVSVSGAVLTINPTTNLAANKAYAIQIAATAIDDTAGNSFAGISDNSTWTFTTSFVSGSDGTWLPTTAGPFDWSDSANWASGNTATGADYTANFTPNITAGQTVNLAAPQTIGNITFTDSTTSSNDLTISGGNILTLERSSGVPIINVTQSGRTLTISSQISGNAGLQKSGAGILKLSSASNNYTGGTVISAGVITLNTNSEVHLGAASSGLTFNGGSLTFADTFSLGANRAVTINPGASVSWGTSITVNGVFAGSGTLNVTSADNFIFSNANNTFTGAIASATAGQLTYGLSFASIGDSVGAGLISLSGGGSGAGGNAGTFRWTSASGSTTTLENRQFAVTGPVLHATQIPTISALGTTAASNLVIKKDLLIDGTAGVRTLRFAGTNTGNNTFEGKIADGAGSVVSLQKAEAGKWILSNTGNTFTGAITLNSTTTSAGTLAYASAGGANAITFNQTTGSATLSYTGAERTMSGAITANALTTGTITLDSSGGGAVNYSNTASLGSAGSGNKNLVLTGSNTGNNILAGQWVNNTGGSATLAKNGGGTWVLSGNNTHTGATTVTAGKLLINGNQSSATGNVSVAANATLGGTGIIGGNTTIAANGRLEFNLSTPAASHDKLELASAKSLTFSGASTLTLTSSGGSAPGDYTLVTAPGGFGSSVAPATIILPNGWLADLPRFVGSDLKINITATGSIQPPYDTWAGAGTAFDADANNDGVDNGMAWVLGAIDKNANAVPLLPTMDNTSDPNFFIFTYRRDDDANTAPNTSIKVEYGSTLGTWIPAVASPDIIIIPTNDGAGAGVDLVQVKIRRTLAVGGKLFARLSAVKTP